MRKMFVVLAIVAAVMVAGPALAGNAYTGAFISQGITQGQVQGNVIGYAVIPVNGGGVIALGTAGYQAQGSRSGIAAGSIATAKCSDCGYAASATTATGGYKYVQVQAQTTANGAQYQAQEGGAVVKTDSIAASGWWYYWMP